MSPGVRVSGEPQAGQELSGAVVPQTTSDTDFTVEDNPANYQMTVSVTGTGDCTLAIVQVIDGQEYPMGDIDSGFVGETETLTVQQPEPGDYRVKVGDFLGCGAYSGSIEFLDAGSIFDTKGAGDTWSNWSEQPTGWAFTNVGPSVAEGLDHSADAGGSEKITLDILNIGDGETDVSPGFVRGADNQSGGTDPVSAGTATTLRVPVFNNGGDTARDVPVEVRRDGPNGTLVASGVVTVPPYSRKDFTFRYTPAREGALDLFVTLDRANNVFEASDTNNRQKSTLWVGPRRARVLIVDDDGAHDAEDIYAGALASLGIPYAIATGHADAATMRKYEAVVWEAGLERYQGQMDGRDRAAVREYLDGGGRLLYTSPRAAAALGEPPGRTNPLGKPDMPPFLRDYFGIEWVDTQQVGGGLVTGLGDILGDRTYATDVFPGRPLQDVFNVTDWVDAGGIEGTPTGTVTPVASWEKGGEGSLMATRVDGDAAHGGFKTVFVGFNLSQLVATDDVATVLKGALDHLGVAPGGYKVPSSPIVFDTRVRNRISGTATPIKAFVLGGGGDGTLFYRRHGQGAYWSVPMTRGAFRGSRTGTIPANAITPDGVDYYLKIGTAFSPRLAASGKLAHAIGVGIPEIPNPVGVR